MKMPKIMYGTAWKKEKTAECVIAAIRAGFRGIDTACQPKHYNEGGVGDAIQYVLKSDGIKREDLFIQTKFTSLDGQDLKSVPYDKNAPLDEQVRQSLDRSLTNLTSSYVDALVLHGPLKSHNQNLIVWREFERFVDEGKVRQLGVSNFYNVAELSRLYDAARIKPKVLQNRFFEYSKSAEYIRAKDITYQSFWTLTSHPEILNSAAVLKLGQSKSKSSAQLLFAYLIQRGVVPLTGTTDIEHMKEDLDAVNIKLAEEEMKIFDKLINL